MVNDRLIFGVILPHTRIFGGVKRFFEIGNILISRGHRFIVITPDAQPPGWFPFRGEVMALKDITNLMFDALFTTEPEFLTALESADSRLRIFYAVLQRPYIRKVAARKDLLIFANSGRLYRYLGGGKNPNVIQCVGGIDTKKFDFRARRERRDEDAFVVLAYGRFYRKKKGTSMVVKSCENLYRQGYNVKLLLFDSPVDETARKKVEAFTCRLPFHFFVDYPVEKLPELYHQADLFVSAERNAGWSNTSAEAMACGVPVVATRSGTEDFLIDGETGFQVWRHRWFIQRAMKKLYQNQSLRRELALNARKKIEEFSWESLTDTIERVVRQRLAARGRDGQ